MHKFVLSVILLGLFPLAAEAQTFPVFPTDINDWEPVVRNSDPVGDVLGDGTGRRDLVGDFSRPVAYMASDANFMYGRIRLNVDPRQGAGLAPFSWGFLVDTDGNYAAYEFMIMVDGISNPNNVLLQANTTKSITGDPGDAAELTVWSGLFSNFGQVVKACDQIVEGNCFESNDDFYLDFAIPWVELAKTPVNFLPGNEFAVVAASGNSNNTLSNDYAGIGTSLTDLISDEICTDSDFDGISDCDEDLDGDGDPANDDTDCDGTPNYLDADDDNDGNDTILEDTNGNGDWFDDDADADGVPDFLDNDDLNPFVAVSTPADGDLVNTAVTQVEGLSDPDAEVSVSIDGGTPVVTTADASGNWTAVLTSSIADGLHSINVVSTSCQVSAGTTTTFTQDTTPPALAILTPTDGTVTESADVLVSGTAEVGSTLTVSVDGQAPQAVTVGTDGTWTLQLTGLALGGHTVLAVAEDAAGNTSTELIGFTVNVDECADPADNDCSSNAACIDTPTSFTCECLPGFEGDGVTCTDIDECALGTDTCSDDATCTDTEGSFECACLPGFVGDGFTCTDIDECALGTDTCADDATCTDTDGSFECSCLPGYQGDGFTCTDIDECVLGTDTCADDATCTDTDGSFECACLPGYEGDGFTCTDIDECATGADNCSADATCTDTDGSFECACLPGYEGDGVTCTDIDECALGTDTCADDATCTDTDGSFECACLPGYQGDGFTCTDIDECATGADNCSADATCTDTDGSFECACLPGYEGDGVTCTDIDECQLNTDDCAGNTFCSNLPGTFTCEDCPSGFESINGVCEDIDECLEGTDTCDDLTQCTNTTGGFECSACPDGYTDVNGDGTQCDDIDECLGNPCDDVTTCTNSAGSFSCTACPPGYADVNGDGTVCEDINECLELTDDCDELAVCVNETGGFTCETCPTGYEDVNGDGTECVNIDECTLGTDNCDENASCTDVPGSFVCECLTGYEGDGVSCERLDGPIILVPAEGEVVATKRPTISGTGEPDTTIDLSIDGNDPVEVEVDAEGHWTYTPDFDLAEGDHSVEVTDGIDENSVEFTVDTRGPEVEVITPADGREYSTPPDEITGEGEPGAEIIIVVDGEEIGTTEVDEDGKWSFPLPDLEPGGHTIVVTGRDDAGNETEVTTTFDVVEPVVEPELLFVVEGGGCSVGAEGGLSIWTMFLLFAVFRRRRPL